MAWVITVELFKNQDVLRGCISWAFRITLAAICASATMYSLSHCAPHRTQVTIDPAVLPYVANFVGEGAKQGHKILLSDLIVQFGTISIGSDARGECVRGTNQTPTITLAPEWKTYESNLQEQIIYHELGHCVLNREHVTTKWSPSEIETDVPASIMNATELDSNDLYTPYHDHFMQELFANGFYTEGTLL